MRDKPYVWLQAGPGDFSPLKLAHGELQEIVDRLRSVGVALLDATGRSYLSSSDCAVVAEGLAKSMTRGQPGAATRHTGKFGGKPVAVWSMKNDRVGVIIWKLSEVRHSELRIITRADIGGRPRMH